MAPLTANSFSNHRERSTLKAHEGTLTCLSGLMVDRIRLCAINDGAAWQSLLDVETFRKDMIHTIIYEWSNLLCKARVTRDMLAEVPLKIVTLLKQRTSPEGKDNIIYLGHTMTHEINV